MRHLDPLFSPRHLLDCSTDRLVPAEAYAAIAADEAEWHRLYGGAAAASPVAPPPRGGDRPVETMAGDIVGLAEDHGTVTRQYLVALGWDPAQIDRHGPEAQALAARMMQTAEVPALPLRPTVRRQAGSRRRAA